jgi:inorganic triphosphatase YgiF
MAQETEIKLALFARDLSRLLAHPLLAAQEPQRQRLLNTYFDTPDLALMRQRIAVRERRVGRRTLLTVKTAGASAGGLSRRGEWEGPTQAGALDFSSLVDDAALARALTGLKPRLVPVFRTDFRRRSWQLNHGGAHIEVALDEGRITTRPAGQRGTRQEPILELELELKSGPVDALLDLAHTLALGPQGWSAQGIWLYPSDRSKAERGLALFLGHTPEPLREAPLQLPADGDPVQAFCSTAWACLAQLQGNVLGLLQTPGTGPLPDPEYIHQARVALRRLRTGLRLFRRFLPRRFSAHWSAHWQTAAGQLGDARNWDVLATTWLPQLLGEGPQAASLTRWADQTRREANQRARQALTEPAFALGQLAFVRALLALQGRAPRTGQPALTDWAQATLQQRHRSLQREVRLAARQAATERHELRIELKKLRYAQSFLSSLLPPKRRGGASLKRAQDVLGTLNDLHTAQALLASAPPPAGQKVIGRLHELMAVHLAELPSVQRQLLRSIAAWS